MSSEAGEQKWRSTWRPAELAESLDESKVRCHLSPRQCVMRPGQRGFCGVRGNVEGQLVTYNYGKSVHATEECIETEAVAHFAPGERILSMGNIGCMLNCAYCHNWKTSQARSVSDADVHYYTPEQVVDIAERHGIRVLSWTYNDPVVWQEFVRETAALARARGMVNLYKSAFFISEEAIEALIPVMDIFSISLKSMDPAYYRRLTKGWIEPVLAGIEQVYRSGRHLELSTLMVTNESDDLGTASAVSRFIGERLDPSVPLHLVRFHPDYKMTDTIRTPTERLFAARTLAREMGIRHVFVGNVFDPDANHSHCACGNLLVHRYGLRSTVPGLTADSNCTQCGKLSAIRLPFAGVGRRRKQVGALPVASDLRLAEVQWAGDIRNLHVQVRNSGDSATVVYFRETLTAAVAPWSALPLLAGESYRFMFSQGSPESTGAQVAVPPAVTSSLHQVFDRAHFPTVAIDAGTLNADVTPFPRYERRDRAE